MLFKILRSTTSEDGIEYAQSLSYPSALRFTVAFRFSSVERMMDVYTMKKRRK